MTILAVGLGLWSYTTFVRIIGFFPLQLLRSTGPCSLSWVIRRFRLSSIGGSIPSTPPLLFAGRLVFDSLET